jgi:hypothetical protein
MKTMINLLLIEPLPSNTLGFFRREPSERPSGRLVNFLLKDPIPDAGQWDMVVNVIEKYGKKNSVVSSSAFVHSFHPFFRCHFFL